MLRSEAGQREGVEVEDLMDPYHKFVNEELKDLRSDLKYYEEDIQYLSDQEQIQEIKDLQQLLKRNFVERIAKYREQMK